MVIFQYNWEEFKQIWPEKDGSTHKKFLSNFPPDIDFSTPSKVPEFRNPLIKYFNQNQELFSWYGISQSYSFYEHLNVLERELITGRLSMDDFGDVFDFGMGIGISTILFSIISKSIFGVDMRPNACTFLDQKGVLQGQYLCANGITYMNQQPKASYDLITSFNFGFDDMSDSWTKQFYDAALRVLKPNGKILTYSFVRTIDQVRTYLGIPYRTEFNPKTIITTHEGST